MKEGATAYFGPTSEIQWYFLERNLTIPEDANIADFVGLCKLTQLI
jgi:hypothetical protein